MDDGKERRAFSFPVRNRGQRLSIVMNEILKKRRLIQNSQRNKHKRGHWGWFSTKKPTDTAGRGSIDWSKGDVRKGFLLENSSTDHFVRKGGGACGNSR